MTIYDYPFIHFFGLGFIQVKISDTQRYHFYTNRIPRYVEHPHNHRYSFQSEILCGNLNEILYEPIYGDTHFISTSNCMPKNSNDLNIKVPVGLKQRESITHKTGEVYVRIPTDIHTVEATEDTITFLTKTSEPIFKEAFFIYEKNDEPLCPFSKKYDESELWGIVKEMWASLPESIRIREPLFL